MIQYKQRLNGSTHGDAPGAARDALHPTPAYSMRAFATYRRPPGDGQGGGNHMARSFSGDSLLGSHLSHQALARASD